jgi:hypothetical protein
MSKNNGDLPCVRLGERVHITVNASKCLCGARYEYGVITRAGISTNIIYRNINAVTCEACKKEHEAIRALKGEA